MTFEEYQARARTTDVYADQMPSSVLDPAFAAKILGLVGEAGEVAEKFKKIIRDKNGQISTEDSAAIIKELGDVLWYVALIAEYLGSDIGHVASVNLDKLADRQKRNVIKSSGDDR